MLVPDNIPHQFSSFLVGFSFPRAFPLRNHEFMTVPHMTFGKSHGNSLVLGLFKMNILNLLKVNIYYLKLRSNKLT